MSRIIIKNKDIRSAKRSKNEREGVHKWHPYYAGYSEIFVDDILTYFEAKENSIVFDPWMGSGTTALVCQKRGIKCFGNELNPVMVKFAKAKTAELLKIDLVELTGVILQHVNFKIDLNVTENEYLSTDHNHKLRAIQQAIDYYFNNNILTDLSDNAKAFYYAVLFRCIRTLGGFSKGSNPTWLLKSVPALSESQIDVLELFKQLARSMINDLSLAFHDLFMEEIPVPYILEGDSRSLGFESESFDFVITSPPYLTRIDYAVSTKPELLFLGYAESTGFDKIRRETMGAPVISEKGIAKDLLWGEICLDFLNKVEHHTSKASKSYYLPLYLQYFRDAIESLQEIKRVLRTGGKACLVVQSSYYKDVEAKLGDMYVEMGTNIGMNSFIIKREEIKNHIAHVNTKSSAYVKNKIYYEDAVIFQKR